MIGVEARCCKTLLARRLHRDTLESVLVEVATQRGEDVFRLYTDHEPKLAIRYRARRNRVHRAIGIAAGEREHLEAAPAEDALGRREAGLAPIGLDRGTVLAAIDHEILQRRAHRGRERARPPLGHANGTTR